ncbi:hypothetical protein C0214_13605 [Methylobacterium sp. DM1]|nr:hypothetical protein C0214_13605 [Methylobacterium sp. DM1]
MSENDDTTERGLPALVYKGEVIHERHETLSLTDMWKAAGAPDQKNPAKWRALPTTKAFAEHVATVVGKSDNALFRSQRGGADQGTWAHWQIAMAYAKYLDHDFHMWCNRVVRERMEGVTHQVVALADEDRRAIGGIAKSVVAKAITDMVPDIVRAAVAAMLDQRRAAPTLDFAETVSAYQMIEMAGIPTEDRQRGTAQMVTNRMIAFCSRRQVASLRTPAHVNPAEPYRFPYALACEWLLGPSGGALLIRNQIERMKAKKGGTARGSRQMHMQLVTSAGRPVA